MKMNFKKIIRDTLFNLKWRCNLCDDENFNGDYFCDDCKKIIPYIKENKCEHCGRLTAYSLPFCDSCIEKNVSFDKARSLFSYESPIDRLIWQFKYNEKLYFADIFSDMFVEKYLTNFSDTDFITFVPSTDKSLKERGYNQSFILADRLSQKLKVGVVKTAIKTKETPRQATLNYTERLKNLEGAFNLEKVDFKDKNVLLVDDVLTTGTTADLLAKLYKKKGANKVYVLTVASVSKIKIKGLNNN